MDNKYYVLVRWPESQLFMEEPWFNECIFAQDIEGHDEVGSSAYFVPIEKYNKLKLNIKGKKKKQ